MGEVYKARDTRLKREVAIKVSPERFNDRFEREAHAIAALNHPNICTLYDIGPNYLVMELVEGQSLSERLKQGRLPLDETQHIAHQIAEALECAHEKGIVHRDLKPGNIILKPDGAVKVLDFGLATLTDSAREGNPDDSSTLTMEQVTRTGVILGTAAYMAPEQARGEKVDKRADIWAFGVVLYEMLTARRLFKSDSLTDTLAAVLVREPDWSALPAETPLKIRKLLRRCLDRDRKQRLQAIGEARIAIDAPEEDVTPPRPTTAKKWWPLAASAVAVAAAFAAGWWLRRPPATAPDWTLTRLTSDVGLSDFAALSPDGKLVAYTSDRADGERDLYMRQIVGGQSIRLTADGAGNTTPNFSPDGGAIVFRSNRDGGGIYKIPALGGDARLIARDGLYPKFSPDGSQIAYWVGSESRDSRVPGSGTVWLVPAAGGIPQRVGSNFTAARSPIWSADGKHLLLVGYTSEKAFEDSSIDWWLVSTSGAEAVKTGAREALTHAGLHSGIVSTTTSIPQPECWSAGDNMIVFSAATGDADNLWKVPILRSGKLSGTPQRLTTGGNETHPSCTPGGILAFTNGETRRDVWSVPADLDHGVPTGTLVRITQGPAFRERPSLSSNGRLVAFASNQSGQPNIWLRDLMTGKESSLAPSSFIERYPLVNKSGTRIAYSAFEGDKRNLYVSAPGGTPEKLCEACLQATDWSGDENTLLVFGGDPYQISFLDLASHRQTPLLKHATYNLLYGRFSPDNRWVSFTIRTDPNRARIAVAPIDAAKPVPENDWITIADVEAQDWAKWSPDGKTLYFTSNKDGHSCLWAQRLEAGSRRPVGDPFAVQHFHGRVEYRQGGWSAAGGRIALVLAEDTGNIWMMSRGSR